MQFWKGRNTFLLKFYHLKFSISNSFTDHRARQKTDVQFVWDISAYNAVDSQNGGKTSGGYE